MTYVHQLHPHIHRRDIALFTAMIVVMLLAIVALERTPSASFGTPNALATNIIKGMERDIPSVNIPGMREVTSSTLGVTLRYPASWFAVAGKTNMNPRYLSSEDVALPSAISTDGALITIEATHAADTTLEDYFHTLQDEYGRTILSTEWGTTDNLPSVQTKETNQFGDQTTYVRSLVTQHYDTIVTVRLSAHIPQALNDAGGTFDAINNSLKFL